MMVGVGVGLTVTIDVLKLTLYGASRRCIVGLTVTIDVLKYRTSTSRLINERLINSNNRCFEINVITSAGVQRR